MRWIRGIRVIYFQDRSLNTAEKRIVECRDVKFGEEKDRLEREIMRREMEDWREVWY